MSAVRGSTTLILTLALAIFSCDRVAQDQAPPYEPARPASEDQVYAIAIHPLHNPKKLHSSYQPLVDYLNLRGNGWRLELEASRDYGHFEGKYQSRGPHVLLPNPWQTLQAMKVGYSVIATAGEPGDFRGMFIVRRDSSLRYPKELKGKAVSYPAPTALAACIMPQYFLYQQGLDVNTAIENRYVGSQESSIMNVYLGQTAAGATWPPPWRAFQKDHPAEAAELKVMWETPPLINNSVMVRDDLPSPVRETLRTALIHLHETAEGRAILSAMETGRFHPASDRDYEVVRAYVARFERNVRPVEGKR